MHAMYGLLVMDMKSRLETQSLYQNCRNINEACRWMININMTSTIRTPHAITKPSSVFSRCCFIVCFNFIFSFSHFKAVRLPKCKSVYRPCRPFPA